MKRFRHALQAPTVTERDPSALQAMLQEALGALAILDAGRPAHRHTCADGHQWYCTSPYCEPPFAADCPAHGGEPVPYVTAVGTPVERWS
jgi:hypothetical protein